MASTVESDLFESLLLEWAPGNLDNYESVTFELTFANNSKQTTDYEKIISQQLNGKSSKYDFFMLDCVWTGKYGEHLIDLQGKINSNTVKKHSTVNLNTCKYNGKLRALPLYSDFGIMLYREDLLEKYNKTIPTTWNELEETASYIMEMEEMYGNKELEGYAGQFKDEALIYDESHSLEKWEKGNILFLRNWPNSVRNTEESFKTSGTSFSFGVTRLPGRDNTLSASTLGGWNIGVSKYSKYPLLSSKVIEFITGEKTQKLRAIRFGLLPTIKSLYYEEITIYLKSKIIIIKIY
ncbi:hypothetical protein PIROE2DRAFT_61366 [Piromyces sp. E2]|nr:hypothetical protein PIROE2DRAFT_61366 [Piromyces sp. E2]|eukprot:OUM63292.1 hypothetical protein PIROE2DRAFT_61366 [Piromyces sp. E2]